MIEYVTPALAYRLEVLGVRKEYITTAASGLLKCWKTGDCRAAGSYKQLCDGDPICNYIKNIVINNDREGAMRTYSWFVLCRGRRLVKLIDVNGRYVPYDYTEWFTITYPPPFEKCG
ncbi:MAG: hypothetical protein QW251_03210 [Desulfurococcaceae archaeon]